MAQPLDYSRRKALKIIAGAPMLPLGSAAAASLLAACGSGNDHAANITPLASTAAFTAATFGGTAAPSLADPAAMATTTVASTMTAQFSDGSSRAYKLKIDRGFVRELAYDAEDAAIVSSVLALGQTLGIDIVAEGVETAMQKEFLTRLGCNSLQGFLLGRPVPASDLSVFWRACPQPSLS